MTVIATRQPGGLSCRVLVPALSNHKHTTHLEGEEPADQYAAAPEAHEVVYDTSNLAAHGTKHALSCTEQPI